MFGNDSRLFRLECVIAPCLRPPIAAVFTYTVESYGLRKLHKFTRVLENVLSNQVNTFRC